MRVEQNGMQNVGRKGGEKRVSLTGVRPQMVRRFVVLELLLDVVGEPSKLSDAHSTSQDFSSLIGELPLPRSVLSWILSFDDFGFIPFTSHISEFFELVLNTSEPCSVVRTGIDIFLS